ncbi:hypothetical protein [Amycolatopsis sp. WQ 127309]|uniref:hypothetical protein n=1 Tax=Amycolatopsis sp. WQ 127309 TaxID=2932773 RepID=UPI001FF12CFB|nr:hypothetical protein [Amycolatopsis sp. WQ 127309]UOZ08031.1 hypothetical protein MUY22_07055 [Amycolatopsis sp. WQ 127309]
MAYDIEVYPEVQDQIRALPRHALPALAEAIAVLEIVPDKGDPYHRANPDGAMRNLVFGTHGEGLLTYLVLEDQNRVDLLRVLWTT